MKTNKLHKIFRFAVCTIIGAYVLLLCILNFGPSERMLTQMVATELSKKLHTEVTIDNIEIGLFNRVIINNLSINDLQGKKILKSRIATAKIELRSLLKDQLSLRTISLIDTQINLYKQHADSAANYQFLIDAFSSNDNNNKSKLNLRINSIILRRISLKYDEQYKAFTQREQLNPSHLAISQLNANISLKSITPDSLNLRVRSLSFYEQSGLCLKKLRFKLTANRTTAHIENFCFEMPHTRILQSDLIATYDIRRGFNQLLPSLHIGATISKLQVSTTDIRPFIKLPQQLNQTIRLSTTLLLTPQKIQLNQLTLNNSDRSLQLIGNISLQRNNKQIETIHLTLNKLFINDRGINQLSSIGKLNSTTTATLQRIGTISASGNATYQLKQKIGLGSIFLRTNVGNIAADAHLADKKINANIHLSQLQPDILLNNKQLPTFVTLNTNVCFNFSKQKQQAVSANGNIASMLFNNHSFSNIHYDIKYQANNLAVNVQSNNSNADLSLQTHLTLQNKKISQIRLNADVRKFNAQLFNIKSAFGQATYSGNIKAHFSQNEIGIPLGELKVYNFNITNGPHGNYQLDNLQASICDIDSNIQHFNLRSDFLDTDLTGKLSLQQISNALLAIIHRNLPGLVAPPQHPLTKNNTNKWYVKAQLKQTDVLEKLFGVKIKIQGPLHIMGTLNANNDEHTSLSIYANKIESAGQSFEHPSIYINGVNNQYHCLLQTHKMFSGRDYGIVADLSTQNGLLTTQLEWNSTNEKSYKGSFESITEFMPIKKGINFNMHIRPTQFVLADTIWNIASGQLSYINQHLAFSGVKLSHANQSLRIDGEIAPNKNDSIVARLHNLDIDYILGLVDFDAVSFGGQASGQAIFTQNGHTPQLHTQLSIPDFTFNNGQMGVANIKANWNKEENKINIDADMHLPHTPDHGTNVQGYVSLAEKGLNLNIGVNHTKLDFLQRYIGGIFGNFTGDATGNACLYGPFKKLDFKGQVKANCKARVLATGADYEVKDGNVVMSSGEFAFNNFKITDKYSGVGTANGALRHTHLKKLNYTFNITANNLLCYNQPQQPDLPFYSTTFGSGKVLLQGWPNHFTADIALTPNLSTLFVYDLGTQSALSKDDRMIRFHTIHNNKQNIYDSLPYQKHTNEAFDSQSISSESSKTDGDPETDMQLNFNINMTPQAQIRIITDNRSGDAITAYGQGALRASWHNKGGFEIFGTYTLNRGEYNISLQDIIRKNLQLQSGSSITFTGDPLNADLNLKALYTVNGVSLNDLNYGAGFSNKTVRADCILNIGGKARAPQVSFDLDLHNISEDEKQMIRQLIATDDDMNRQAMYLLGIGRFMSTAQNISNTTTTSQQSSAAMRSFLSTTLTGQLNSAISSVLGTQSKWTFGTNFMPGTEGWNTLEVDGLLQGRLLNDRLLINGNFGYRDNPYYASNFIGDFDIRYLLTPRGSISLRAYSETNDRYFTKSSLTTQGVGIMLQREFSRIRDLFKRKKYNEQKAKKIGKENIHRKEAQ